MHGKRPRIAVAVLWSVVCLRACMIVTSARVFVCAFMLAALGGCGSNAQDGSASSEAADTAGSSHASLANFVAVRPGLYRGGHPDAAGLSYLKSVGVRRIVNLEVADFVEAYPWDITKELDEAQARGLTEIRYPMSAFEPAVSGEFDRHIDEILAKKVGFPRGAVVRPLWPAPAFRRSSAVPGLAPRIGVGLPMLPRPR